MLGSYPVSDATPGVPSIISCFPSGVNFRTVWSPSSTVYTAPSGPNRMQCVRGVKTPSPQAVTKVPSRSYTITRASLRVMRYTRSLASTPAPTQSKCL